MKERKKYRELAYLQDKQEQAALLKITIRSTAYAVHKIATG